MRVSAKTGVWPKRLIWRPLTRKATLQSLFLALISWFGGPTPGAAQSAGAFPADRPIRHAKEEDDRDGQQRSTAEDFLRLDVRPIAIRHHGVGPNGGENPAIPIENSRVGKGSVRAGCASRRSGRATDGGPQAGSVP